MTTSKLVPFALAVAMGCFIGYHDWQSVVGLLTIFGFAAFIHYFNADKAVVADRARYVELEAKIANLHEELAKLRLKLGFRPER